MECRRLLRISETNVPDRRVNKQCCMDLLSLPPEVLLHILSFLPANEIINCRLVCSEFRYTIDMGQSNHDIWQKNTMADFKNIYKKVRSSSIEPMSWFDTYRSLRSWCQLRKAREDKRDYFIGRGESKQIINFELLDRGVIGVHTKESIDYYQLPDMEPCRESKLGKFENYAENRYCIAVLDSYRKLTFQRKRGEQIMDTTEIDEARKFVLIDKYLYYSVRLCQREYVFKVDLVHPVLDKVYIAKAYDPIVSMGCYEGYLLYINTKSNIYRLFDDHFRLIIRLRKYDNILDALNVLNLLEDMDWHMFYFWMVNYNMKVDTGVMWAITSMKAYGKVFIVGCKWGFLRIYYNPFKGDELDILNRRPTKQYKLCEREYNFPIRSFCPIVKIDIIESESSHTVIAAMPSKVVQLKFTNNFEGVEDPSLFGRRRNGFRHYKEVTPTKLEPRAAASGM